MFQKWWQAVLLAAVLTLFVAAWHFLLPSMLNGYGVSGASSVETMAQIVKIHQVEPAFLRRPLCTWVLQFFTEYFGWTALQGFVILNFSLLFACNLLIYVLARLYNCTHREGLWSLVLFMSSFSILFAFFAPIYTYDEPLQYFFILLSLVAIHFRSSLFIVPCLFMALVARESTFFLFLAFYALSIPHYLREESYSEMKSFDIDDDLIGDMKPRDMWVFDLRSFLPFVLSAVFYYWFVNTYFTGVQVEENRFWFWLENFQSAQHATETLVSFFLVLGLPLFLILYGDDEEEQIIIRNFFFALILNTLVVIVMTKAREGRLFALPLLLYFPIAGKLLLRVWSKIEFSKIGYTHIGFLFVVSAAIFSFTMYYSTDSQDAFRYYQAYLFILLLFCAIILRYTKEELKDEI